jgi:hypothetical protein
MLHLTLQEKQEQANPKTNGRTKIIKIRAEISEIETTTTTTTKPYKESMSDSKMVARGRKQKVSLLK